MRIGDFLGPADSKTVAVTGTTTSEVAVAKNPQRTKLMFQSHTSETWYVRFGGTVAVDDHTLQLASGAFVVVEAPIYTGSITMMQASASGPCMVTELSAV